MKITILLIIIIFLITLWALLKKNDVFSKKSVKKFYLEPHLAPNDKDLFYYYLDRCSHYFEYGSGGSTYQASIRKNINSIHSVESDYDWYQKLKSGISDKRIKLQYYNLYSRPNNWGYPGPESTLSDWKKYSGAIVKLPPIQRSNIDLILIDGRFRVACCLNCHRVIKPDCLILFDDFLNRPEYHIVLKYFHIVNQTSDNRMVVLKKKEISPPTSIIKKYEKIHF